MKQWRGHEIAWLYYSPGTIHPGPTTTRKLSAQEASIKAKAFAKDMQDRAELSGIKNVAVYNNPKRMAWMVEYIVHT